jgi:hypothetical protein
VEHDLPTELHAELTAAQRLPKQPLRLPYGSARKRGSRRHGRAVGLRPETGEQASRTARAAPPGAGGAGKRGEAAPNRLTGAGWR